MKIIALARRGGDGREAAADHAVELFRLIGSPGQALDEAWLRETTTRAYDIAHDPEAGRRQLAACRAGGDRRAELARVRAPTLVVHGRDDPMQSLGAGRATAEAIPGRASSSSREATSCPPACGRTSPTAIVDLVHARR